MNGKTRISVVVPIYNVEPYLRQCLDSIINQTYKYLEIILVDDGSPDNCGDICDEYAAMDSRIIVIHKKNAGLSAARNDGIIRASGEWISFIDSDDWCDRDYYERLLTYVDGADVDVFCANGAIFEYESHSRIKKTFDSESFFYNSPAEMEILMAKVLMVGNRKTVTIGVPWDKLYRTSFLRKNQLFFDPILKAWEDLWFNFQVFDKAQKVAGYAYTGYHYRMVENSLTKGFNPHKIEVGYEFLSKLHFYLEGREKSDIMSHALNVRAIEVIINSLNAYQFHPRYSENMRIQVDQIREIKEKPYFYQAIHSKCNIGLNRRLLELKFYLQLPWIWPLQISKKVKRTIKNILWHRRNR